MLAGDETLIHHESQFNMQCRGARRTRASGGPRQIQSDAILLVSGFKWQAFNSLMLSLKLFMTAVKTNRTIRNVPESNAC